MTNSTIFCGCSYVQGIGLDLEKSDPRLWVNILHQGIPELSVTELHNAGTGGSTNEEIFLSAINQILQGQCKYLFVAWTSLKRLKVNPSVELYSTQVYMERKSIDDVKINPNTTIPGSYIENIRDRFFDLTHIHYDLLKILQYTTILDSLASRFNINIFFVNSLLPVDTNYFSRVSTESRLPSDTTMFTQNLLNLKTRDDKEYFEIYDKIHLDYKNTGSLLCNWINLDHGFRTHFYLDQGNDNLHPGPISNQHFADFLLKKLQSNFKL